MREKLSDEHICIVVYPARSAGEVSYIYGVFESEDLAKKDYFSDSQEIEDPAPQFINCRLFRASPSQSSAEDREER